MKIKIVSTKGIRQKMKIAFVILILFAFGSCKASDYETKLEEAPKTTLVQIIQSILIDPEFVALDSKKKLNILVAIYNMLVEQFDKQNGFRQKRDTSFATNTLF